MFCHIAEDVSSACWRVLQIRLQADMQALLLLPLLCCTELHPVIVPATSETEINLFEHSAVCMLTDRQAHRRQPQGLDALMCTLSSCLPPVIAGAGLRSTERALELPANPTKKSKAAQAKSRQTTTAPPVAPATPHAAAVHARSSRVGKTCRQKRKVQSQAFYPCGPSAVSRCCTAEPQLASVSSNCLT